MSLKKRLIVILILSAIAYEVIADPIGSEKTTIESAITSQTTLSPTRLKNSSETDEKTTSAVSDAKLHRHARHETPQTNKTIVSTTMASEEKMITEKKPSNQTTSKEEAKPDTKPGIRMDGKAEDSKDLNTSATNTVRYEKLLIGSLKSSSDHE